MSILCKQSNFLKTKSCWNIFFRKKKIHGTVYCSLDLNFIEWPWKLNWGRNPWTVSWESLGDVWLSSQLANGSHLLAPSCCQNEVACGAHRHNATGATGPQPMRAYEATTPRTSLQVFLAGCGLSFLPLHLPTRLWPFVSFLGEEKGIGVTAYALNTGARTREW